MVHWLRLVNGLRLVHGLRLVGGGGGVVGGFGLEGHWGAVLVGVLGLSVVIHMGLEAIVVVRLVIHLCRCEKWKRVSVRREEGEEWKGER